MERIYAISEYSERLKKISLFLGAVEENGRPGSVVSILEDVVTFHLGVVNYPRKNIMT